jgi:replicative DNA helicase
MGDVGGGGQARPVITVLEGLHQLKERASHGGGRTTGFAGVDEATGGFELGRTWLVTGTPGQGRTTLAAQWAWLLADQHGLETHFISTREPATLIAARVAAAVAKIPQDRLWTGRLSEDDSEKLRRMTPRLEAAPFTVLGPGDLSILDADLAELPRPQALVIDDALTAPSRVAAFAQEGMVVVLTVPHHRVLSEGGVDPRWAEVADIIVDINRPDLLDRASLRPGDAELHILRNRWGPTRVEAAAFQGHYARFVALV